MVKAPAVVPSTSLERDPLKVNSKNFLWKAWQTWFQADPNDLMYDCWEWMTEGPDLQTTMGFRGFSKSFLIMTYCGHLFYDNPEDQVLNLAGSVNAARGNASLLWGMIHGFDWLAHLRPRGYDRSSAQAFDVYGSKHEKSESFASLAILSGDKTGRRCRVAVPDDIETPTTSATENDRQELRRHFDEVGGAILKPEGIVRVIGTAQTEDTIYIDHLANKKGYATRIWPVEYPTPEEMIHYGPWLAPIIRTRVEAHPELAHTSTEPIRFPDKEIAKRKIAFGLHSYRREFLMWTDVGGLETKPLKLRDLIVVDIPTPTLQTPLRLPSEVQWAPYQDNLVPGLQVDSLNGDSSLYFPMQTQGFKEFWQTPNRITLQVDPSGGGSDEVAWDVCAELAGRVFLLAQGASLEGFTAPTMQAIARDAKTWGVQRVRIEKNFGGGMFSELLRPYLIKAGLECSLEEEWATGAKEARIVDTLEPVITDHRLVVNRSVLLQDYQVSYDTVEDSKKRNYRLTYQLTRITRDKGCLPHDDRVDCLAANVGSFLGSLKRELEQASQDARDMVINQQQDYFRKLERERQMAMNNLQGHHRGSRVAGLVHDHALPASPLFANRLGRRL